MREIDPTRYAALAALAIDPLTVGVPAEPQPETDLHFRNWRWLIDRDGIGWALLDEPGSSVNTLSEGVLGELDSLLGLMERVGPAGLAIRSLKPSGFIAGAEIREFADMTDEQIITERIGKGLAVLDRAGAAALSVGGADPWLLPRRRARAGAGGELSHRHQGGAARLSGSDARASPRARRDLAAPYASPIRSRR